MENDVYIIIKLSNIVQSITKRLALKVYSIKIQWVTLYNDLDNR